MSVDGQGQPSLTVRLQTTRMGDPAPCEATTDSSHVRSCVWLHATLPHRGVRIVRAARCGSAAGLLVRYSASMPDQLSPESIYALERPHASLLTLYVIRALLSGPLIVIMLPVLLIRYHTLRYRFDEQGIHMRWGLLFRREVNLTYARVQDIHLRSGVIQRWLGLADLLVQTASGSATPEMTIEGFPQFEGIRDFLYARMRGAKVRSLPPAAGPTLAPHAGGELLALLVDIRDELRAVREGLERAERRGAPHV
jgi:membrane protein YdbS with pleckstrin-like domain